MMQACLQAQALAVSTRAAAHGPPNLLFLQAFQQAQALAVSTRAAAHGAPDLMFVHDMASGCSDVTPKLGPYFEAGSSYGGQSAAMEDAWLSASAMQVGSVDATGLNTVSPISGPHSPETWRQMPLPTHNYIPAPTQAFPRAISAMHTWAS
jgi:hypothetical protein